MILDQLVELDEERITTLDIIVSQEERVANSYNKKIKQKMFLASNLVWKVILLVDQKDINFGKWTPNQEGPFKTFSNNAYEIDELTPKRRTLTISNFDKWHV